MKINDEVKNTSVRMAILRIIAVVVAIIAIFVFWWKGLFLPTWIDWQERELALGTATVTVDNRKLSVKENLTERIYHVYYQSNWDWSVQDALVYDINKDGEDELIMLVWKHGSYGKSRPMWVKRNDIRLEQHIFIYKWDEDRVDRLDPLWMSSSIGKGVAYLTRGNHDELIITTNEGKQESFRWANYGLKEY